MKRGVRALLPEEGAVSVSAALLLLPIAVALILAGTWLMTRFMIAEGAITLAAFPISIAIVGTYFLGPLVAATWGMTVFLVFDWVFGMPTLYAGPYGLVYGIAAWLSVMALRRFGFGDLYRTPVRVVFGWYLVIGLAAPVATSLAGVPLLIAGGAAAPDADVLLLMVSNFISDSFSPLSLGLGLYALIAAVVSGGGSTRERHGDVEVLAWFAAVAAATLAVTLFGEGWARRGIGDVTPAFYLLLAWSALRFSLPFTMLATAGIGLVVITHVTFGLGGTPIPATTGDALSVYANLLGLTILAQLSAAMTLQRSLAQQRAIAAELDRAHLKRYFSPRIVDDLLQHSDAVSETRLQNVVVMFVDIVGFTSIAEAQTPEETIAMLREFDTAMEAQIFEHDGVVDKYIGDGVMAAFGLPRVGNADVTSALECAVEMVKQASRLVEARRARGRLPYRISIGLHYGEVVAGNVGSERNLAFTVIGDAVNTASRLEAMSREEGASIVISDDVVECVRRELRQEQPEILHRFRRIGERPVRGRQQSIGIWVLPRGAAGEGEGD